MLVATIAGTATYKWLSSHGSSSSARMQQQEAYQSAIAGIQETRSWITFHANDAGALIRQYLLNGKKPVLLNSRLSHAISDKQNFDVWLTGVSKENGVHKLKILSKGKARNNSTYTEAAILNVSGLYQVPRPSQEEKRKSIDFAYAYFGSTVRNHGAVKLSSMLINGNWHGNPMDIDENLIITGWARPSGSDLSIKGTGCLGGDLYLQNRFTAKNIYLEDELIFEGNSQGSPLTITGNAYFNGTVSQYKNGFTIGNMTVGGTVKTNQSITDAHFTVNGDLCVLKDGIVKIADTQNNNPKKYGAPFQVKGNVWTEGYDPFYTSGGDFSENYDKLILGKETTSKLYIKNGHPYSDYEKLREDKTFKENKNWKKVCTNPTKVGVNGGGCLEKQWTMWNDEEYTPYIAVPSSNDKFYFYHLEPGVNDVEFLNKTSTYWNTKDDNSGWKATNIASYYVGGLLFNDNTRTDDDNEFNYNDGNTKRSPYCKHLTGADPSDGRNAGFRPECHVTPWFKSNGTLQSVTGTKQPIPCANATKQYCDEIWEKKPGCDGSEYKIDDILVTALAKFEPYASKGCAATITTLSNDVSSKMNNCYRENKGNPTKAEENLYNGYLVVKLNAEHITEPKTPLDGKFIIILNNDPQESFRIPPTANDQSFVMFYMKKGASRGIEIQPADQTGTYNYFIYTKHNVGVSTAGATPWNPYPEIQPQGGFLFNHASFNGSIYAAAENCAKVSAITTNKAMNFNQALLDDLTHNQILCQASVTEANCGGKTDPSTPSGTPASSASGGSGSDMDEEDAIEYFISIAPQLDVTLESQYKSNEAIPAEDEELNPSIVVIPRIIYLSKDAKGTLPDYYSVVNLNGASEDKSPGRASCLGSIPTTGALYQQSGSYLQEGTYSCEYASSSYGTVPFYVVVGNAIGNVPDVSFTIPEQELQLDNEVTVSVKIPPYAGPGIEFNIGIPDVLEGWEIVPKAGVSQRMGSGGYKVYYTVKTTASATEEKTMDVLTIKSTENALDGNMTLMLTTPLTNCNIGEIPVHIVKLRGRANVMLGKISDYCNISENESYCTSKHYFEKSQYLDCYLVGQRWIEAYGDACSEKNSNTNWVCKTSKSINLRQVSNSIPNHCEVVIPEENNSVQDPAGGETYTLYASIKRKKVNLTIDFNEAEDDRTQVTVYDALENASFTCTYEQRECTFKVYAGAEIVLDHNDYGIDDGNFAHWACTGSNCPYNGDKRAEKKYTMPAIYEDHTVTASYRKADHCFYEDFTNFYAFCRGDGNNQCLDTCAHSLGKGKICEIKNSTQSSAKWLTMYSNAGDYIVPIINNSSGYITANVSKNANNNSGRNTLVLSTVTAGQYGTLNALIQTRAIGSPDANDLLNSGFIIRSSGDSYLIVNVFGATEKKDKNSDKSKLTFRVCRGDGQSINNYNSGDCKIVENDDPALAISPNDFVKLSLTLDDNDMLKVKAVVNDQTWNGHLDIKPYGLNDAEFTYVGFGLGDDAFKIYDIGWTSTSFSDDCWDTPTVSCSFADNYIGGTIPINEEVSPKVIISSWFTEKNCRAEYHYNGCDNQTSERHNCSNNVGDPGKLGVELNNTLGIYNFTETGTHGYMENQKKTRDAQIKVVCPGDQTSLDLAKEFYSCGTFSVGETTNCSDEIEVYNDYMTFIENEPSEFIVSYDGYNMRGATLNLQIDDVTKPGPGISPPIWGPPMLPGAIPNPGIGPDKKNEPLDAYNAEAQLTLRLRSTNGMYSLPINITTKGVTKIDVNEISNTSGFNPQMISDIIITSNSTLSFEKLRIYTECSHNLKVHCDKAEFNMGNWEVFAHADGKGITCSIKSDNPLIQNLENITDCDIKSHKLPLELPSFKNMMDMTPFFQSTTFTFSATDENGDKSSCTIKGSNFSATKIDCSIPNDKTEIVKGENVPPFTFTINTNFLPIPSIDYKLFLDDNNDVIGNGSAKSGIEQTKTAKVTDISLGEHEYRVEALGESCSAKFTVVNQKKTPPKIESCSVDDKGKFTAVISNPDNVEYKYTVGAMTDPLGNIAPDNGKSGSSKNTELSYTFNKPGTYTYMLKLTYGQNEIEPCSAKQTIEDPSGKPKITCSNVKFGEYGSIVLEPTITNCDDGCGIHSVIVGHYENGQVVPNREPTNELLTEYSFWHNNASGSITYVIQAFDKNDKVIASCDFDINFDASSASTAKSSSSVAKSSSSEAKSSSSVASSSSRMSSSSAKVKDYRINKYGGNWITFNPGTYNITCDGNPNGGTLVCQCLPDGCTIEYEGIEMFIQYNQQVSRNDRPCNNGHGGTLKVFSKVECKHDW